MTFSEPLEPASAETPGNYRFEPAGVTIRSAHRTADGMGVQLALGSPLAAGVSYRLMVEGVRDASPAHNAITRAASAVTLVQPAFILPGTVVCDGQSSRDIPVAGLPVGAHDPWTINFFARTGRQPDNRTLIAGFGGTADLTGHARYLSKFANGIHFWSSNQDGETLTPLDLDRWQMLTATCDGSTLRIYKDAVQIGTEARTCRRRIGCAHRAAGTLGQAAPVHRRGQRAEHLEEGAPARGPGSSAQERACRPMITTGVRRRALPGWGPAARAVGLVIALLCRGTAPCEGHPTYVTLANAVVQADGTCRISIEFDLLAFTLNDTSARIGNEPMEALLNAACDETDRVLRDASARFARGFSIVTDHGEITPRALRFPTTDDLLRWKSSGQPTLPVIIPVEVEARLPAGTRTVAFRFPGLLADIILTVERPSEDFFTEPVDAGKTSTVLSVHLRSAEKP